MQLRLVPVVICLVALPLAGCGGGGTGSTDSGSTEAMTPAEAHEAEEAKRIRDHVQMFTAAFGSGDVETACALFSPQTIKQHECESIYGPPSSQFERSFLTAKIERVVIVDETKATVALSNGQILRMIELGGVRGEGGGDWLVEDLGGEENTTR